MSNLRKFLLQLLIKKETQHGFESDKFRILIISNAYLLVGFSIIFTFSIFSFSQDKIHSFFLFSIAILTLGSFFYIRKTENTKLSGFLVVIPMYALLVFFLLHDGFNSFTLLWYFVFPPITLFLLKRNIALIIFTSLYIFTIIVFYGPFDIAQDYTNNFKIRFLSSFFAASLLSYIYEVIRITTYKSLKYANLKIKRQSEELQKINKELHMLSTVVQKTDNAVSIFDKDGELLWINRGCEKLFGYSLKETIEKKGKSIYKIASSPKVKRLIDKMIEDGDPVLYDFSAINRHGKQIHVITNLSVVYDENNHVTHIIAVDTNITEIKKIEEQLKKQVDLTIQQKKQMYWQNESLEKKKLMLEMALDKVQEQRDKLQLKNKEVTDSIHYAQRIQKAIIPTQEEIKQAMQNEYFIFYKPKDIISGDFYFVTKLENELILAVIDCTGHGVPGALMSMLGMAYLNEIINNQKLLSPQKILCNLRATIIDAFYQEKNSSNTRDGMDIAITTINTNTLKCRFAGANNPLYIIRNKTEIDPELLDRANRTKENEKSILMEFKGNKMPVGMYELLDEYTEHEIQLKYNDVLYLFTDGFADQFGGKDNKKFKYSAFKDLLLKVSDKSMQIQQIEINRAFNSWIQNREQVDDICIMGVRF